MPACPRKSSSRRRRRSGSRCRPLRSARLRACIRSRRKTRCRSPGRSAGAGRWPGRSGVRRRLPAGPRRSLSCHVRPQRLPRHRGDPEGRATPSRSRSPSRRPRVGRSRRRPRPRPTRVPIRRLHRPPPARRPLLLRRHRPRRHRPEAALARGTARGTRITCTPGRRGSRRRKARRASSGTWPPKRGSTSSTRQLTEVEHCGPASA